MDQKDEQIFTAALLKSLIEAGCISPDLEGAPMGLRLQELGRIARSVYRDLWPAPPVEASPPPPSRARPTGAPRAPGGHPPVQGRFPATSEPLERFEHERITLLKKTYPPDGPSYYELMDGKPKGRHDLEYLSRGAMTGDGRSLLASEGKWARANEKIRARATRCLEELEAMQEPYDAPRGANTRRGEGYESEETPF